MEGEGGNFMITRILHFAVVIAAAAACFIASVRAMAETAPMPSLKAAEHMVDSDTPGIKLYLRNKHPENMTAFSAEKTVLFVHGSTYPAETSFDLPLGGMSWMDYIAGHGYDVWLVDVRGYGRSTRPKEMEEPADAHPPLARTPEAVRDVASAVDYI